MAVFLLLAIHCKFDIGMSIEMQYDMYRFIAGFMLPVCYNQGDSMMTDIASLANKNCVPCQGDLPPLGEEAVNRLLMQLKNNWHISALGHLYKQFKFVDFMSAMNFANQVATLSEQQAHHPDLTISWGACKVEIWTHKINGLTESDFILAAKIESIKN